MLWYLKNGINSIFTKIFIELLYFFNKIICKIFNHSKFAIFNFSNFFFGYFIVLKIFYMVYLTI